MKVFFVLLFVFLSCASGGFPRARTTFRDVLSPDSLVKSYNSITEVWKFEQEYMLHGIVIGASHQDIFPNDPPSDTYIENITVHLVEHNGTYGAPRKLIGIGTYSGNQEYKSSIFVPFVAVDSKDEAPIVKPISVEHTLYYIEIDIRSQPPGLYPYYFTRDLDFFGAVAPETTGNGIVVGIEYSKP